MPWYFDKQWSYYNDKYPDLVHLPKKLPKLKENSMFSKKSIEPSQIFKSPLMTKSTLINKYLVQKYHSLKLLLKRIKLGVAVDYDFESL